MDTPQPQPSLDGRRKIALFSLGTGLILLVVIVFNAQKAEREGNEQLRNDSYLALLSPVVFFGIGAKLLQTRPETQRNNRVVSQRATFTASDESVRQSQSKIAQLQAKTAEILERAHSELSSGQLQNNTLIQQINALQQQQSPQPEAFNADGDGIEPFRQALAKALADHQQLEATTLKQSAQIHQRVQALQDDARKTANHLQLEQKRQQQSKVDQLAAAQQNLKVLLEQQRQAQQQRQHQAQQQQASLGELKQSINQYQQKQAELQQALEAISASSPAAAEALQQTAVSLQSTLREELDERRLDADGKTRPSPLERHMLQSHGEITRLQDQARQLQHATNSLLSQQASLPKDQHQQLSALKTELLQQLERQLDQELERLQTTQQQQQQDHLHSLQKAQASQHQLLIDAEQAEARLQELQSQLQQAELDQQHHLEVLAQRIEQGNSDHAQAIAAHDALRQQAANDLSQKVDRLQSEIEGATLRFNQLQANFTEHSAKAETIANTDRDAAQVIALDLEQFQRDLTQVMTSAEALCEQTTANCNAEVNKLDRDVQTMAQQSKTSLNDQQRTLTGLQRQLKEAADQLSQHNDQRQAQTQRTNASLAELEGNAKAINQQLASSQHKLDTFQRQCQRSIDSLRTNLEKTNANLKTLRQGSDLSLWPETTQPGRQQGQQYHLACQALAIPPGSPWPVVRETWRRNVKRWHPDQGGDPQVWMHRQAAYQLLEAWYQFDQH